MSWVHATWIAGVLVALAMGHHTMMEGRDLAKVGYHLCTAEENRKESSVVVHTVPYVVQRHCGGWLPWRMCNVTLYKMTHSTEYKEVTREVTRCCHGYVRVGHYCALPLNRTREFTTKPGFCPTTAEHSQCQTCVWDIECPGSQKCCEMLNGPQCVDPATFSRYEANGGWRLNVTVTVKVDFHRMTSVEKGLVNHTQLLHAMVSGALNSSDASVQYLSSCPVDSYRTATSLLISCNTTLSLEDTTANMHRILRDIAEVSDVTVEDVDECAHTALRNCSPHAECDNTVASYRCTCRHGYADVLPGNAGASCEVDRAATNATTCHPGPTGPPSPPETPGPSAPPTTLKTSTAALPEEMPMCAPPQLTQLSPSNVTGTSFCLTWTSLSPSNQTSYRVDLSKGSEYIRHKETNETVWNVTGLDPGVLYAVTVTPIACNAQGGSVRVNVRTAAQTLTATARVTNMNYTEDFQNSTSEAYVNFSRSVKEEILKSLSAELRNSGKVRIEITSLSPGSVVVNFTIVYDMDFHSLNVSSAVLSSLLNSTRYTVDENSTSLSDFNECASSLNDCSQNATCNNTWGSYKCVCNEGFDDMDSDRPGRVCGDTTTTSLTTTTTVPTSTTSLAPPTTVPTTTASLTTTTTVPTSTTSLAPPPTVPITTASLTTTTTVPTSTTSLAPPPTVPITTASLTKTTTVPTSTTSLAPPPTVPITTASLTTTTTVPTSTTSLAPPTTVPTTTTSLAPPTTVPTTTASLMTSTTVPTSTTSLAPPTTVPTTTTSLAPPTTVPTTTASLTTSTTVSTSTTSLTTQNTVPTSTTSLAPPTTVPTTTTSLAPPTTVPASPTSVTASTTVSITTTSLTTPNTAYPHTDMITINSPRVLPAISVECSLTTIMVTVAKEFLLNNQISELSLHLGQESNQPLELNDTHVQLTVAWNDTKLLSNDSYYTAKVTLFNSPEPRATRNLQVPITCTYRRSVLTSTHFGDMGYNINIGPISALGSFEVIMQLLNGTYPLPHNHTLSPDEDVVVVVAVNTTTEEMKLVISRCWATPTLNPTDSPSYIFLNSGCPLPDSYTAIVSNGNSSSSSLSVRIFSFVTLDVVYLHCQVQICVEMGLATCVPDCNKRKARLAKTVAMALGSSGALMRSNDESLEEKIDMVHLVGFSILGIGMSLAFLVGLTCLFFYQRNRIGHYNFNIKPKQDNFTFHAFNT